MEVTWGGCRGGGEGEVGVAVGVGLEAKIEVDVQLEVEVEVGVCSGGECRGRGGGETRAPSKNMTDC